jgi:hypothetical protein
MSAVEKQKSPIFVFEGLQSKPSAPGSENKEPERI